MFATLRIRAKLAIAILVPLLALVLLSGVAISSARDTANEASRRAEVAQAQVDLATSAIGPGGVISAMQAERNIGALELLGLREVLGERPIDEVRVRTDDAIASFRRTIADSSAAVQAAYVPSLEALDEVVTVRAAADAYGGPRDPASAGPDAAATFDAYGDIINTLFDVNSTVALGLDDAELRSGARFIDQVSRLGDHMTLLLRTIALPVVDPSSPGFVADPVAFGTGHGHAAMAKAIQHELMTSGTPAYRELAAELLTVPALEPLTDVTQVALAGQEVDLGALLSTETTGSIDAYEQARDAAAERLEADAAALIAEAEAEAADASDQADLVTLGTVAVLILAVLIALLASRSIARPLRRLAADAEDMAATRLPEAVRSILNAPMGEDVDLPDLPPISAAGGPEIGELATALNTVQVSAAELAIEQAVLRRNISDSFVNLGRRNQNLLSRQLDSITEMEREETDPDGLEKLFTLDHLATRMRRNAESLLLLAGLEPHRQWSVPVPLIDVIRGALGEVEEYSRVDIARFDDALVSGSAAADLTHMVAELLENALNFSPPGRDVSIAGARRGDGYTLAIIDNGMGMEPEAMEQANVRLAGGESFTVAPSRYLGHYVVGIQAARLNCPVSLQDTPTGGVTALIDITALLATEASLGHADAALAPGSVALPSNELLDAEGGTGDEEPPPVAPRSGPVVPFEEATSYIGIEAATLPAPATDRAETLEPIGAVETVSTTPAASSPRSAPDEPLRAPARPDLVSSRPTVASAPAVTNGAAVLNGLTPPNGVGVLIGPDVPDDPAAPDTDGSPLPASDGFGSRAADGSSSPGPTVEQTTASGYKKRVRGTHAPRTEVIPARGDRADGPAVAPEGGTSAADEVRSMLSGLQAGTQRAQAEVRDQEGRQAEERR